MLDLLGWVGTEVAMYIKFTIFESYGRSYTTLNRASELTLASHQPDNALADHFAFFASDIIRNFQDIFVHIDT